jgi:rhodanese-related sulfurtransferase
MNLASFEPMAPLSPAQLGTLQAAAAATLVDVRGYVEFAQSRLPGSICIPLDEISGRIEEIPAGRPVVCICATGRRSELAAGQLCALGQDARYLAGGLAAWKGQRLPVWERPSWALERQVRLGAGLLVLLGLLLSGFWTPAILLTWLVGAGLVFAALSDTCLMGAVLMKMPWNRAGLISKSQQKDHRA